MVSQLEYHESWFILKVCTKPTLSAKWKGKTSDDEWEII